MYGHDVEQRFAQIGRAAFCSPVAARAIVARFARCRVNTYKGNKRLLPLKAADIPNLRHELRAEGFPNAVHFHDNWVFRELRSQLVHLTAVSFHAVEDCCELIRRFLNKHFCDGGFLRQHNSRFCQSVHLGGFLHAELVAVSLAPLAVALGKSVLTAAADAIDVPEVMSLFCVPSLRTGLSNSLQMPGKDCS